MKTKHTPRARTTQALTGSHAKVAAHLDFDSALAIEWARAALRRGGTESVHISGVIRRALALYVKHVEQSDPRAEHRAVGRVSKAAEVPEEDARMAELRLRAVPPEEPLPSFQQVRYGPQELARRAAMHQRIENLLESLP
jgi:hypothetical protein